MYRCRGPSSHTVKLVLELSDHPVLFRRCLDHSSHLRPRYSDFCISFCGTKIELAFLHRHLRWRVLEHLHGSYCTAGSGKGSKTTLAPSRRLRPRFYILSVVHLHFDRSASSEIRYVLIFFPSVQRLFVEPQSRFPLGDLSASTSHTDSTTARIEPTFQAACSSERSSGRLLSTKVRFLRVSSFGTQNTTPTHRYPAIPALAPDPFPSPATQDQD